MPTPKKRGQQAEREAKRANARKRAQVEREYRQKCEAVRSALGRGLYRSVDGACKAFGISRVTYDKYRI